MHIKGNDPNDRSKSSSDPPCMELNFCAFLCIARTLDSPLLSQRTSADFFIRFYLSNLFSVTPISSKILVWSSCSLLYFVTGVFQTDTRPYISLASRVAC
eukprot:5095879-Amphidinium_carterae.1